MEHAANLAVAALDERDCVPGVGSVLVELDFGRRSFDAAIVVEGDVDAVAETLEGCFVGASADFDEISFGDVRGGLGELLGEGAIVGEEEKPLAGVVEAADGIDAGGEIAEELHDGGTSFGIVDGGNVAFGFIQHEIDRRLDGLDGFAVNGDGVGVGIGFGAEFGDDLAVDGDAAGGDEFLGFAARGNAGGGEDFLEAFGHGDSKRIAANRERRTGSRQVWGQFQDSSGRKRKKKITQRCRDAEVSQRSKEGERVSFNGRKIPTR